MTANGLLQKKEVILLKSKKKNKLSKEELSAQNRSRILTKESPYAIKEAYVQLRTNLMFSVASGNDLESGCRVFAVTSPGPSDGKSTNAANIAVSFAMLGERTLLIDCDMRKPNVHKLWNLELQHGMSNLLTNINGFEIHKVNDIPLSIITAGDIPPNPSELLASSAFGEAIRAFRKSFDCIIIDTPPVNVVADARIISEYIDGMIIVMRSGISRGSDIARAEEELNSANCKIAGVVINDINLKKQKYYTGSYHGKYYNYYRYYRYGRYSREYYTDYSETEEESKDNDKN